MNKSLYIQIAALLIIIIIFNIFVLPNMKDSVLSVEKQQKWSKKVDSEAELILMENAILQITNKEELSELTTYDKETGKELLKKDIPQIVDNKNHFFYSNTGLYYFDFAANNTLYKLDTETLSILWGRQLAVEFSTIEVEKCRDILFVNMKDSYLPPDGEHIILDDLTGQEIDFSTYYTQDYNINEIFDKSKAEWDQFHYFETANCVFNASNNQLNYIQGATLIIDSPLKIRSIGKGKNSINVRYFMRNNIRQSFMKAYPIYLGPHKEKNTNNGFINTAPIAKMKANCYHKKWTILTYEDLFNNSSNYPKKEKEIHYFIPYNRTEVEHKASEFLTSPSFCVSEKYLIGVKQDRWNSIICFLEFDAWKTKSLPLPKNEVAQKLLCDKENLYIHTTLENNSMLYAVPLDFAKQ